MGAIKDEHWKRACVETFDTLMLVGARTFKPTDASVKRLAARYRRAAESEASDG